MDKHSNKVPDVLQMKNVHNNYMIKISSNVYTFLNFNNLQGYLKAYNNNLRAHCNGDATGQLKRLAEKLDPLAG